MDNSLTNINHTSMKKLLSFLILLLGLIAYPQASSKLNNGQNTISTGQPRVIVSADSLPSGLWRTYWKPSVTWNFSQIVSRPTTLAGYGITDAYPLSGNPSNFLTGITSSQVNAALGYTPYNSTNPSNYISGITSGMVTGALGYNPVNPNGASNQYIAGDGTKINFPSIPAPQVNADWNAGSGLSQILNKPLIPTDNAQISNGAGYVNTIGARNAISITTTGTGSATYNSTTGVINVPTPVIPAQVNLTSGNRISITGTYPNLTISYIEPTINQVTRNVNTNYTIGTRQATVFYAVPVTATNPLLIGTSVGTAFLEYSTNSGTNWTTALPTSTQSSVGLSVTIQLTTGGSNVLSGVVPANALVRIRTTISGTATVGNAIGQEVY